MGILIVFLVAGALFGFPLVVQGPEQERHQPGLWSKEAIVLSYVEGNRRLKLLSLDGEKAVSIEDTALAVEINGKRARGTESYGVGTLAELAWSPDSRAFFVTQSDGGNVGTWYVDVFLLSKVGIRRVDIAKQAKKEFMTTYKCVTAGDPTANEQPNIAALKWLNGSNKLLLVAEVPPHSSCPEMGKLMGYVVSVPSGRVLQRYKERELRKTWSPVFGERLSTK